MAAGLLKSLLPRKLVKKVRIISAGVSSSESGGASKGAIEISKKSGIDIAGHTPKRLTRELIESADLILAMQRMHMEEVRRLCPSRAEHALLLTELGGDTASEAGEICDPCCGSEEVYERCFAQIEKSLRTGMKFIVELIDAKDHPR